MGCHGELGPIKKISEKTLQTPIKKKGKGTPQRKTSGQTQKILRGRLCRSWREVSRKTLNTRLHQGGGVEEHKKSCRSKKKKNSIWVLREKVWRTSCEGAWVENLPNERESRNGKLDDSAGKKRNYGGKHARNIKAKRRRP